MLPPNLMSDLLSSFSSSFESEAHVRQALRTLLSKIPNVTGAEITHGSQEVGKDLVFYSKDFLDQSQLHACVVKWKKIDGTTARTGAREVLIQVGQCFDTPHINTDGQEEYVSRVLVVSPHDCPPSTMNSIRGDLKQRAGQVKFLCGQHLMDKFGEHWPDFLLFGSSALNLYVASLTRNLLGKDPVQFLLKARQLLSGELDSLERRYVRQGFTKSLSFLELLSASQVLSRRSFSESLSASEVRQRQDQFKMLATLFRARAFDSADPQAIADALDGAADAIAKEWRASYEASIKAARANATFIAGPNSARVPLAGDYRKKNAVTLDEGEAILKRIEKDVALANQFVESCRDKPLDDKSSAFETYCSVEDLTREAPSIFRVVETCRAQVDRDRLLEEKNTHLLITAPAGFGKTSFCKIHAVKDALSLSEKKTDSVPVYVPLQSLATTESLDDSVFFDVPEIKSMLDSGDPSRFRWTFYLDGLDEIADRNQRAALVLAAQQLANHLPSAKIIMTSRNYISGPELLWLTRIDLAELNEGDVQELAQKWLGDGPLLDLFYQELIKSRVLRRLCAVPLLATLTLAVFKKDESLPRNKLTLYQTFTDLLCGGWDYVKGVNRDSRFGRQEKIRILTRLAGILHLNKQSRGNLRDLRRAVADVQPELLGSFERLLSEMLEDGLLQRTGGELAFSHLSFQEFLAAREFPDPSGERSNVLLMDFLRGDDWWREVIAFYVAGPQRPDEMERWIRKISERVQSNSFSDGSREQFLFDAIADANAGWKPSLI